MSPPVDLAAVGLSEAEVLRKRLLFDLVFRAFDGISALPPSHSLWVPGRLEVFGKHTDYGGGHSLVAPVPRGFALAARHRADGVISIHDASRREHFVVASQSALDPDDALKGWRRYALTTVRRLARNFPGAQFGADVVFASDLPPASGMSSSSSLVVAIATALGRLAQLDTRPEWLANIKGTVDTASYYACIENGLPFGTLEGDGGVGTHGGSEDHVAIVCGRAGHVSAWTFVPSTPVADVRVPPEWEFVIATTGVPARKAGAAKEPYNQLARDERRLLDLWNVAEPRQPSLREALTSSPEAPSRLRDLLARQLSAADAANLDARLTQFLNEDARVVEAVDAFRHGDLDALGALSHASHQDAELLLRNQVHESTVLVRLARELGAFAASSFGAGFGGSVWALVRKEEAGSFAARWLTQYRSAHPASESATAFEAPPGPPLTWLS